MTDTTVKHMQTNNLSPSPSILSKMALCLQNRAVVNLFRGPNLIDDVATTMRRLEDGDLKLRVRALDSERALTRVLVRYPPAR